MYKRIFHWQFSYLRIVLGYDLGPQECNVKVDNLDSKEKNVRIRRAQNTQEVACDVFAQQYE